ncbi:CDP-diacylglycerol--inositol 3-phosphatidyltransferase isoform X2 [Gallus gallus]|uniref:CDP-diacylglycerol--inositol 3-phosphatidyltransferase isoform X2 n=1 Tax=Gallus gallus TaxID=9031 RepID=UPI001AE76FD7|nr:CDP-diacylglycerol--inositol 3-phosphatidyltransferase isoform X2 [Gallus gallus]
MAGGDPNVFLYVPNVIGYARVALSAVSVVLMPHSPLPAALCYALSAALDAVDGLAARWLNQGSRLGAMLDMLTDRCSLLCLQLNLALLYPSAAPLLQLSVCLDIASHWLHMHTTTLEGGESHKSVGQGENRLLQLYYGNRTLLFSLCAANEGFFCCLYLEYFYGGLWGLGTLQVALLPLALLKALLNALQLQAAARRLAAIEHKDRKKT